VALFFSGLKPASRKSVSPTGRRRKSVPAARSITRHDRRLVGQSLEDRCLLTAAPQAVELFNVSPALFVENLGQWSDPAVRYAFQGSGANVLHTQTGPVIQLFQREDSGQTGPSSPPNDPFHPLAETEPPVVHSTQFSVYFVGANVVEPVGMDKAETAYNYFVGDQSNWRSAVPTFQKVGYLGLYDGIDLYTWGRRDSLKYEFHVAPGADYREIQVQYQGIEGLSLDRLGNLHVQTSLGELVDDAPCVYQEIGGRQIDVPARFELVDAQSCRFVLTGDYDPTKELVIDPDLAWATFLGGSGGDSGQGIAVDGDGNALATGWTLSSDFAGANNSYHVSNDAFVAKIIVADTSTAPTGVDLTAASCYFRVTGLDNTPQDPTKDTVNLYASLIPPSGPNNKHAINPLDYVLAVSGPWNDLRSWSDASDIRGMARPGDMKDLAERALNLLSQPDPWIRRPSCTSAELASSASVRSWRVWRAKSMPLRDRDWAASVRTGGQGTVQPSPSRRVAVPRAPVSAAGSLDDLPPGRCKAGDQGNLATRKDGIDPAQNPAQQPSEMPRDGRQTRNAPQSECGALQGVAAIHEPQRRHHTDGEGFEPPVDSRPQQFSRLPP
jgi:hypothetical protein